MKKSMIAAAVVATAAVAGAANASFFTITPLTGSGFTVNAADIAGGFATSIFNQSGNSHHDISGGGGSAPAKQTNFDALFGNSGAGLSNGLTLAADTLYYFGYTDSGTGLGYFGFAYTAGGSGQTLNVNWTGSNPTGGFYSAEGVIGGANSVTSTYGTYGSNQYSSTALSLGANDSLFGVFAGMTPTSTVQGNISTTVGRNFNVRYLTWTGTAWADSGSGSANNSSNHFLAVSTYSIPVPAPALLAGAGLVGAAALRRRMAKKA